MDKNNWGDVYTTIWVVAGGEYLNLAPNSAVFMAQRPNGMVYFNSLPNKLFHLINYEWQGPVYNTVVTTNESAITTQHNKGKSKEKTKRKGGLLGAAVGTVLMPGVGTAIGYAMTSKKVAKGKTKNTGRQVTNNQSITNQNQVEVDSMGKIGLADPDTGQTFSIGIRCNSQIDIELDGFNWPNQQPQIKEYKALLDSGVITEEEFEKKKQEMLSNQLAPPKQY